MGRKSIGDDELKAYFMMLAEKPGALTKKQQDKLRSRVVHGEPMKVKYTGRLAGFWDGGIIEAEPATITQTGYEYPMPKWQGSDFRIRDEDGDYFGIAKLATDRLYKGFERVEEEPSCQHQTAKHTKCNT